MQFANQNIYLDSQATTPVDPEVLETMLPYFTSLNGNGNHPLGWNASTAVENARLQVASLINARPTEVVFTSGATEAINLGILGLAEADKSGKKHIITQKTEHAAVLKTIANLEERGYRITMLDVDTVGRVSLDELSLALSADTLLVAIMLANNEIGTMQPVKEIGSLCRKHGAYFFCDITQGLGWHPINVDELNIDLASMSSHKIYGPRGCGALFLRKRHRRVHIEPQSFGGGQERGLRPGTINLPGVVGFGKACEIYAENRIEIVTHLNKLQTRFFEKLKYEIDGILLNGCPYERHPGNLSLALPNVTGDELKQAHTNMYFSTTSACASGSTQMSHVIDALPIDSNVGKNTFRIGFHKGNTLEEVDKAAESIIRFAQRKSTQLQET